MMQFAEQFNDFQIVVPLARQLSWSHLLILLPLKSREAKFFYAEKVSEESLGKRDLRKQISLKAFERAAIANIQLSTNLTIPFNTFKDPYLLDFIKLKNTYLEKDLETAILRQLRVIYFRNGKRICFRRTPKKNDY